MLGGFSCYSTKVLAAGLGKLVKRANQKGKAKELQHEPKIF